MLHTEFFVTVCYKKDLPISYIVLKSRQSTNTHINVHSTGRAPNCNLWLRLRSDPRITTLLKVQLRSHYETKIQYFLLKPGFTETNPAEPCLSLGRERGDFRVMRHTHTRYHVLGACYTAVVIIKLKITTNTYEVIAEARMMWMYILLTTQFLINVLLFKILINRLFYNSQTF